MKIEINSIPQDEQYYVKICDGPDGIDEADFLCSSLGECFEQIVMWRTLNAQQYYRGTEND
jgi:hypothetical protein